VEKKRLLSVVVPVYNNEKFLEVCIESILNQTYLGLEIILVDDGSTDSSGQTCDAYALKDSRVRVIHKRNEGACYARRDGILAAEGEYITFVDSDDWIEADMYEKLYGLLLENQADIITSGFVRNELEDISCDLFPEGVYTGEKKENLCANMLFHREQNTVGILMSVCNKIYRRELLLPCVSQLPPHIHLWEDLVYAYPPFILADKVIVTHKCFYHYRRNEESTSLRINHLEYEQTIYTLIIAQQIYCQYGKLIQEAFELESSLILYNYLWRCTKDIDCCYWTQRKIKNKIRSISEDYRFKALVQNVIQQIPWDHERKFLHLLLNGKVGKAIRYSHNFERKQEALNWAAQTAYKLLGKQRVQRVKKVVYWK